MHISRTQSNTPDDDALYTWAGKIIRKRVDYFLSHRPHPRDCEDDLAQECLVHFWHQRHRYQPERGASLETFLRFITDHKLEDLARGWSATKRGKGKAPLSLDRPSDAVEDTPFTLADRQRADDADSDVEHTVVAELRRKELLSRLSDLGQRLARGLDDGHSMAELSRRLAIPRSTLRGELERIRKTLSDER